MSKHSDIGFIVLKLTNNAFCDLVLDCAKGFAKNNPFNQTIIFNSYCDKSITNNIPILHLNHAKFFKGQLFVFDLISVLLSQNFTNISKRYLYTNDIPWLSSAHTSYSEWAKLYFADNLEIITSNDKLFDIYKLCWKKPLGICEEFNYEKICNIIR